MDNIRKTVKMDLTDKTRKEISELKNFFNSTNETTAIARSIKIIKEIVTFIGKDGKLILVNKKGEELWFKIETD